MAVAAANAHRFVDHHKTIVALVHRPTWADLGAGRIFAVVTGDGEVVGEHILLPDAVVLLPVAAGILIDAAEADLRGEILVVLTGQFAGFTPGTASGIDKESILRAHGLLLKPFRCRPGWYAVDSPSPAAMAVGGQRIHAGAMVDPVSGHIRVVPGALAHRRHARHDAWRHFRRKTDFAALIKDAHHIAVFNPGVFLRQAD
ncbi:Uncharacterised protein [Klebsiella aerogenes]|nr:Uncharacterised protein [Klebsiella aerogenes]